MRPEVTKRVESKGLSTLISTHGDVDRYYFKSYIITEIFVNKDDKLKMVFLTEFTVNDGRDP